MITRTGRRLVAQKEQVEKVAFRLPDVAKVKGQFGKKMRDETGPLGAASAAFGLSSGYDSVGGAATGMVGGALGSMASEAGISGARSLAKKFSGSKALQLAGKALPGPLKWVGRGIGTGLSMALPMVGNMVGYEAARSVGNKFAPIWKRQDPKSVASGYISQRDIGVQRNKL